MDRTASLQTMLTSAILGFVLICLAESATQLAPMHQNVPEGESFNLTCTSKMRANGTLYRNELYGKFGESDQRVPVMTSELVRSSKQGSRVSITTVFTLPATEASNGTYGCVPIPVNGSLPGTFTAKDIKKEVTVRVCSEPDLNVNQTDADPIQVSGSESCNYKGELTWLVNGRRVPRYLAPGAASPPAIEFEDDTLEIQSPECQDAENNTCNVTAVFTYISTNRRVSSVQKPLQIPDCCLQGSILPTREETNEGNFPSRPRPELERLSLEKEVLALEKDVLNYKLTAIPLQIKFLKRLNRDQSAGRDIEKTADI